MLSKSVVNNYLRFRDLFSFLEKSHTPDDAYLASDVWESEAKREVSQLDSQ